MKNIRGLYDDALDERVASDAEHAAVDRVLDAAVDGASTGRPKHWQRTLAKDLALRAVIDGEAENAAELRRRSHAGSVALRREEFDYDDKPGFYFIAGGGSPSRTVSDRLKKDPHLLATVWKQAMEADDLDFDTPVSFESKSGMKHLRGINEMDGR